MVSIGHKSTRCHLIYNQLDNRRLFGTPRPFGTNGLLDFDINQYGVSCHDRITDNVYKETIASILLQEMKSNKTKVHT